jgi:UDP-N-acetylmuramyl pentapeptide phosphotransferase/UDP-N-acetylglucosamine-1-phosphate transferase
MAILLLFAIGFLISATLRPVIFPVSRALGLMRANFAGTMIPTGCGWLVVATGVIGCFAVGALLPILDPQLPRVPGGALAAAALLFGALGWLDDRWGDRSVKGLRGHLRSFFRERRLTTGFIKATGGALFGLALAASVTAGPAPTPLSARAAEVVLGGAVIALSANAINLLDLRPLRAIKGFALYVLLLLATAALCAPTHLAGLGWLALPAGALAAYAPLEARCRAMLGDTGANALGAIAGGAAVWALPVPLQLALAAALTALHLFAERRSITATLAAHPWLDRMDRWGWGKGR